LAELKRKSLIDSVHVELLIRQSVCDVSDCPNKERWCFIRDGVHLKIFPQQFKVWFTSINDGAATLDAPTEDLIKSLQPAKTTETNPLRPPVEKPAKIALTSIHPQNPAQPTYPPYPVPPYAYYPPFGQPTPLAYTHAPMLALEPAAKVHVDLRSSSLPSDVDYVERLVQYIDWLSRRSPQQSVLFSEAKNALIMAGHTFETVGLLGDEKFASLGIVEGVGLQIRTKVGRFKRAQAAGLV